MYLSRLVLNPRSRAVQRDLADCQQLHRTIMTAFPTEAPGSDARAALGVLYRVETAPRRGEITLLVQAAAPPDWSPLPDGYLLPAAGPLPNPDTKPVASRFDGIAAGTVLRFRLTANPSKRRRAQTGEGPHRLDGKRVDLRDETDQLLWLAHKAEQHGFRVLTVRANAEVPDVSTAPSPPVIGWRPASDAGEGDGATRRKMTLAAVRFDGLLRVEDATQFRAALANGIGPGKAYGFGLLSVAPAR